VISIHYQFTWTAYLSIRILNIFLGPPEETKWLPVFIAGGMAGLAVLCIIASVVAYVKGQNKTEKPQTDTADQGTI